MNDIVKLCKDYFSAHNDYFWRWAEKGTLIEWSDGRTICYRHDLMEVLKQMQPTGLAPLGTILLVLAACQDRWQKSPAEVSAVMAKVVHHFTNANEEGPKYLLAHRSLKHSISALNMINELDADYRKGNMRTYLLQESLGNAPDKIIPAQAKAIIELFEGGSLDSVLFKQLAPFNAIRFTMDIKPLARIHGAFKSVKELETQLRSGVSQLPAPLDLALPEDLPAGDLLEELNKDQETIGLAQLTQRLIAALHIPMHLQGRSDQSLGGYSDISNRGEFDKLLLSELAHDDLSLTARLVNNEALYLHHESPPSPLTQQRCILVDSTIKMWGYPRIFAIAAALACAQQQREQLKIQALALGNSELYPINLETKAGVLTAMERLDVGLDCSGALAKALDQLGDQADQEVILISSEELLESANFQAQLARVQQQLDYLITVNRDGALQFYQWTKGRRKLLRSAQFDLPRLLLHKKIQNKVYNEPFKEAPAFYQQSEWPLYLPAMDIRPQRRNAFNMNEYGVVGINDMQRLLYWPSPKKGAVEITNYIEFAQVYYFGEAYPMLYILVDLNGETKMKLYEIDLPSRHIKSTELNRTVRSITKAVFFNNHFYVQTAYDIIRIDCLDKSIQVNPFSRPKFEEFYDKQRPIALSSKAMKRHINNGFSALKRVSKIYVNRGCNLCLDQREIKMSTAKHLHIVQHNDGASSLAPDPKYPITFTEPDNPQMVFTKARWPNGSEVIIDPRGLLHLKSHKTEIPAITLCLILGRTISGWSSDGHYCGSPYFIKFENEKGIVTTPFFFETKIRAFVNALI